MEFTNSDNDETWSYDGRFLIKKYIDSGEASTKGIKANKLDQGLLMQKQLLQITRKYPVGSPYNPKSYLQASIFTE